MADAGTVAKAIGSTPRSFTVARSRGRHALLEALRERGYEADDLMGLPAPVLAALTAELRANE